jgi:tetratricopeptide (TPR) repeat protein
MNKRLMSPFIILVLSVILLATAVMPPPVLAQTSKGITLCDSWQYKEAEKVLREALKANPKDIQANFYLGMALLQQDKHEEALKTFLKVLADVDNPGLKVKPSDPNNYKIQIALARTHLELKQNAEALKNLEAANKVHPNGLEVYIYRGFYYINTDNAQKALTELEKAIGIDKKNAYAHYYAGQAHLRLGNPSRVVEELKMFLELAPMAPEAAKAKALVDALC